MIFKITGGQNDLFGGSRVKHDEHASQSSASSQKQEAI